MKIPPRLTNRERDILPFAMAGMTRKEVAVELGISEETVKLHIRNMLSKFGASTIRDGFEDLSHFQKYYGKGGWGLDRFIVSHHARFEIQNNRTDAHATHTAEIMAMGPGLSSINIPYSGPGLFVEPSCDVADVEIVDDPLSDFTVRLNLHKKVKPFDKMRMCFKIKMLNYFGTPKGGHVEHFSFPCAKRQFDFVFPSGDTPSEIRHEVLSGIEAIDGSHYTPSFDSRCFSVSTENEMIPTSLHVTWKWRE